MKLLHVLLKDLRLILRDRRALVAMLVVPIIVIVTLVETESSNGFVVAVVNEDHGPAADTVLRALRQHFEVRETNLATARRLVGVSHTAPAALLLPPDLSQRVRADRPTTVRLLTDPVQGKALAAVRIVTLLASRDLSSLDDVFQRKLIEIHERSLTTGATAIPRLEQRVPGMTVMFVLLTVLFSVTFGLRDEGLQGTRLRLAVAPVSWATILGGKMLARVLVGTLQLLVLLLFGHFVYGLELGQSPVAVVLVALCSVLAIASFALAFAASVRTVEQITPVALGATFIMAAVGGCWWPYFKQPHWMQVIGQGAMTTWTMLALHDVMLRNRGVLQVAPKLLMLVAEAAAWLVVAALAVRWNDARQWHTRRGAPGRLAGKSAHK